ncbi:nitrite reductase small subunit NirD [Marinomonas sp. M1K-6]|uniref:Nitrite reductase small subunit NirD n=1 Tax=Marinomonas profundi TaxID=2726122 RepID=A0A847QUL3_9GAMM|nr:nitrite reductase small subunit NirD [Marinomonas profundi]NLQ16128.1 nitrite reductase small subunit NirD [Marinomonas profundi]UDV03287.1 nitrite reductase small subunit NirD [Marinomonas profundi]
MTIQWKMVCKQSDLVSGAGVAAMVNGEQVALFYVPESEKKVYAIGNWDPVGKANVLSRGLVAHLKNEWVVASPLYKQHFVLASGQCLEEEVKVPYWEAKLEGDAVYIALH